MNNKSATKLLQVLSKQTDKSVETLGAVAILYRCQRKNLDIPAVADEFICHKDQVIKAVVNAHQMDDDDREFARRLMKALALLIEDLATSHNDDSHEARIGALSGMVLEGLNHGCQPDLDTVEVRINYRHFAHTLGLPCEAFRAGFLCRISQGRQPILFLNPFSIIL